MNDELKSKLEQYTISYGWENPQRAQDELLMRFLGETTDTKFNLIINGDEAWVSMTVWPYLLSFPEEKKSGVLELICKLNFQLRFSRLALTEKGEVVICLDIPISALSEEVFHISLDIITYYADNLYPEFLSFWSED